MRHGASGTPRRGPDLDHDLDAAERLLDQLYPDPNDPVRVIFVRDLAGVADVTGRRDFGRRFRDRFDLQDLDEEPRANDDERAVDDNPENRDDASVLVVPENNNYCDPRDGPSSPSD
jgi:hypothetical protein